MQYQSCNGTFLQTRNFLNYHGNKFKDTSFAIYKGQGTIVAVVPACLIEIRDKRYFIRMQEVHLVVLLLVRRFIILNM